MFIDEKRSGEPQQPSVAGFAAFVATKDPAEEYRWLDPTACACGQYARSIGKYEDWLNVPTRPPADSKLWRELNRLAQIGPYPARTFGKLAQKLAGI